MNGGFNSKVRLFPAPGGRAHARCCHTFIPRPTHHRQKIIHPSLTLLQKKSWQKRKAQKSREVKKRKGVAVVSGSGPQAPQQARSGCLEYALR